MTRELRDYQREAVEAVRREWASGTTRTGVVLPTGCGKTDVIADIATAEAGAGGRVLVMAHREELLDQIHDRCKMHNPDLAVGRAQGTRTHGLARPIVVGMAQTLKSENRRRQMRKPTLVIVDECHHAASPSQMSVLAWAGSFDHVRTMGVTATMTRGDKRGLGDVWQSVAFTRDIRWAIAEGWLVPPRGRVVVTDHLDLDRAKVSKGDYQDGELGEMVAQDTDQIVKAWQEHASDRITVAFTPSIDSAQKLAEEFRTAGVPTGEVYGSTRTADRQRVYADLAAGTIRVLVSVMVTTEGWDCPPVSCVLMARPTRLPGLYQQIVGRGLRPHPESGKVDCLVLDVVGASRTQKLVTLVDLHATAEYDRSELDALPCEDCGQPRPCECPTEPVERDPNGGRRKIDQASYEDVDLFGASRLRWLFTRRGTRFLPAGLRMACIYGEEDGTFSAGHCSTRRRGDGAPLALNVTLDAAFRAGEAWALEQDPSLVRKAAPHRRNSASPSLVQRATAMGIDPAGMTRGQVLDEMDVVRASLILDVQR